MGQLEHALGLTPLALALVASEGTLVPLVQVDFVCGRRWLFVAVYFRSPIRPFVLVVDGLGRLVESGSVEGALVPIGCS